MVRPPLTPCDPAPRRYCFVDSTHSHHDYAFVYTTYASWVAFGMRGDSLDYAVTPSQPSADPEEQRSAEVELFAGSNFRIWTVGSNSRAGSRLPQSGSYSLMIDINGQPHERYDLSLQRVAGSSPLDERLEPTAEHAWLTIPEDTTRVRWYALIPDAVAPQVSAADYSAWAIRDGEHPIVLVRDSVYRICELPCTTLDRIVLTPKSKVTWRSPAHDRQR